jgi:hypothetical protein
MCPPGGGCQAVAIASQARLERGTVRRFDARTQVGWPLAITVVT